MYKKLSLALSLLCLAVGLSAQTYSGGVKGVVVNRTDRQPVHGASVQVLSGTHEIATITVDESGAFYLGNLADGMYDMVITADNYMQSKVNFTVDEGYVKNMFRLSLLPAKSVEDADASNFSEFDMDDSGYSDNPTILYGQNDVFNSVASYDFSVVRFRTRGFASETQDVYIGGVRMNDAITGYTPFSLWSGLNEAVRTKDIVNAAETPDFAFGGYNGSTNILGTASNVRPGWRASVLTNSALYRLRLMLTYSSGKLDNGWAYAFSASARLGDNDWVDGMYYRSFGYYAAVEKSFGTEHKLGLTLMAAPGERGAMNGSTQEVYDLMGDNMYNSNWGYMNGKVRNSRVRRTHEPIALLHYEYTPSDRFRLDASLLYRFGYNGYSALDWYDAPDPRPDYYRNLPSYFFMENPDYNRNNMLKYAWAKEAWTNNVENITHLNWDRMYRVNQNNPTDYGNRSKYALENRRVDQRDLNFAANFKWNASKIFTLTGGVNAKWNRSENYKKMFDLLGGDYFLDVDQFAERDFGFSPTMIQNDLDYFEQHGEARRIKKGDKYGYDYYAQTRQAGAWLSGKFTVAGFTGNVAAKVGYTGIWRDGLLRKGLFPGKNPATGDYYSYYDNILGYDEVTGRMATSYGKSEKQNFFTYAFKTNLAYDFKGGHRVYANVGYFSESPTFSRVFMSPRTRNTIVPNLKNYNTFAADVNYHFSRGGYSVRVTGFYADITDQSKVMSFYDDSQKTFTNFAMSGIDQRHIGVELGFSVPIPGVSSLALEGAFSYGKYVYTSNPLMYQTYDNSAAAVAETYGVEIPYWKSTPKFSEVTVGGVPTYDMNANGEYITKGKTEHYVPTTPQLAASLGLSWNYNYWFVDAGVNYFDKAYLDMNPLYRTKMATEGPDGNATPDEILYMTSQEKFDPVFVVNASVGKSWFISRKYQIGFSLSARNLLNNKQIKIGGYEQTRLVENTKSKSQYYKFDPKYFYTNGFNYMLNIYFKF